MGRPAPSVPGLSVSTNRLNARKVDDGAHATMVPEGTFFDGPEQRGTLWTLFDCTDELLVFLGKFLAVLLK